MRRAIGTAVCGLVVFTLACAAACDAQRLRPKQQPRPIHHAGSTARKAFQRPVPQIIRTAILAAPRLRMSGERVVGQLVKGEMVSHTEYILRDGRRVRVTFPTGSRFAGQIIVDDGVARRHYNPKNKQVNEQPSQVDDTFNRFRGPNDQIRLPRLAISDGGTIAGVSTTLVSVLGKNDFVVQQLYIDSRTGAVLRRAGYNPNTRAMVAYFEYRSVNYNPTIGVSDFLINEPINRVVTPALQVRNQSRRLGVPTVLLSARSGFVLLSSRLNQQVGQGFVHELYRGPRGRLSVFVLKAQVDPSRFVERGNAANQAYAVQFSGATVVLVGAYDRGALEQLSGELVGG